MSDKIELIDGVTKFPHFEGGVFEHIPYGAIFADIGVGDKSSYIYDPQFKQDACDWVVRTPSGWTIIVITRIVRMGGHDYEPARVA